jgi:hypothetical protein
VPLRQGVRVHAKGHEANGGAMGCACGKGCAFFFIFCFKALSALLITCNFLHSQLQQRRPARVPARGLTVPARCVQLRGEKGEGGVEGWREGLMRSW